MESAGFSLQQTLRAERIDLRADFGQARAGAVAVRGVVAFDLREIDSVELAEAEEEFFFEGLLGCDWLDLLARRNSLLDHGDVLRGIVDVGPAGFAVEGMRAGA